MCTLDSPTLSIVTQWDEVLVREQGREWKSKGELNNDELQKETGNNFVQRQTSMTY